jgi:tight adherence protein B
MYLLLAGGIYFAARVGVTVFRMLDYEYRQSYLGQQRRQLADLFIAVSPERVLLLSVVVAIIISGLVYWLLNNLILVGLILALSLLVPGQVKKRLREKRFQRFEEQFPEALSMLSNTMRAGLALPHAISKVSEEMDVPISQEFGLLKRELSMGKGERAYHELGERVPLESVRLFVTSVVTCQKMGGNLAEMSDRISETIRSNIELRRELRVMTAEGRFQGILMCFMPFLVAGILAYINPEIMMPLVETTIGHMLIVAVVMLEILGWLVIREILKLEE